jgi:hypothetical protein
MIHERGANGVEDNPDGDPAALEFELLFAVYPLTITPFPIPYSSVMNSKVRKDGTYVSYPNVAYSVGP